MNREPGGLRIALRKGERFNTLSHLAGVFLAAAGTFVLVAPAVASGQFTKAIGFTVYGTSLLLAFLASTLFHSLRGDARDLMRRIDRVAIYLLIAGTYTPIVLRFPSSKGIPLLVGAWLVAVAGSAFELWPHRERSPRSVVPYLILGWMSALTIKPMVIAVTAAGVGYLLAGGIFYTIGGIAASLRFLPRGHEIWHVMALAGSACHFFVMFTYVR